MLVEIFVTFMKKYIATIFILYFFPENNTNEKAENDNKDVLLKIFEFNLYA